MTGGQICVHTIYSSANSLLRHVDNISVKGRTNYYSKGYAFFNHLRPEAYCWAHALFQALSPETPCLCAPLSFQILIEHPMPWDHSKTVCPEISPLKCAGMFLVGGFCPWNQPGSRYRLLKTGTDRRGLPSSPPKLFTGVLLRCLFDGKKGRNNKGLFLQTKLALSDTPLAKTKGVPCHSRQFCVWWNHRHLQWCPCNTLCGCRFESHERHAHRAMKSSSGTKFHTQA